MRKGLGNKRNEFSNANIAEIVELYGDVTKNGRSKVFDNSDFGYRQITVERPLRLAFQVTAERIAALKEEGAFQKLATSKKKGKEGQREIEEGQALQQEIVLMLEGLAGPQVDLNRPSFEKRLAKASRSRSLYPAVMVALNTGMRYREIRLLRWKQLDFAAKMLTVGKSKTRTGTGRVIPMNSRILSILEMLAAQFTDRHPDHYVFPFERCGAKGQEESFGFTAEVIFCGTDTTRPIGDWKEAWEKARERAAVILPGHAGEIKKSRPNFGPVKPSAKRSKKLMEKNPSKPESLKCRFHDLRHTAVTRLLEAGIPYPVVASMMGWSAATAIRMAKRYGHIGSHALRGAADVLGRFEIPQGYPKKSPKVEEVERAPVQ